MDLSPDLDTQALDVSSLALSEPNLFRYFKVTTTNLALGTSASDCSTGIEIDHAAPVITEVTLTPNPEGPISPIPLFHSISGSFSSFCILENDPDVTHCASFTSSSTLPGTYAPSSQGMLQLSVWVRDDAGNTSDRGVSNLLIFDTTPPARPGPLTLSSPAGSPGTALRPTIAVAGVQTGDQVRIHLDDPDCQDSSILGSAFVVSGSSVLVTMESDLNQGDHTFYADSIDPAGNRSACSTQKADYTLDLSPPSAPSGQHWAHEPINPGMTLIAQWDSAPPDVASQIIRFYQGAGCTGSPLESRALNASRTAETFNGSNGFSYSFSVTALDLAGNASAPSCSNGTTVSISSPTLSSFGIRESSPARFRTVTLDYGTADAPFSSYCILINDTDASHCRSWLAASTTAELPQTYDLPNGDGVYSLSVFLQAPDGAIGSPSISGYFELDRTPPVLASLARVLSSGEAGFSTSRWISVIPGGISGDATGYCVLLTNGTPADPDLCTWMGPSGEGPIFSSAQVYAQSDGVTIATAFLIDQAGNISLPVSTEPFVIDTVPPQALQLFALASPTDARSGHGSYLSSNPDPVIEVSGNLSAGDRIRVYRDSGCSDWGFLREATVTAQNGVVQVPLTGTLTSDGLYRFNAKTIDPAGNESDCSGSLDYLLDREGPAPATGLGWNSDNFIGWRPYRVKFTNSASVTSDLSSQVLFLYEGAGCTGPVLSNYPDINNSDPIALDFGHEYSYKIIATDLAGNTTPSQCSTSFYVSPDIPYANSISIRGPQDPVNPRRVRIDVSEPRTDEGWSFAYNDHCILEGTAPRTDVESCTWTQDAYDFYELQASDSVLSGPGVILTLYLRNTQGGTPHIGRGVSSAVPYRIPGMLAISRNEPSTRYIASGFDVLSFLISGQKAGDVIQLYRDAACTDEITGTAVTAQGSGPEPEFISAPPLVSEPGVHTYYARAMSPQGVASPCSTTFVDLIVFDPNQNARFGDPSLPPVMTWDPIPGAVSQTITYGRGTSCTFMDERFSYTLSGTSGTASLNEAGGNAYFSALLETWAPESGEVSKVNSFCLTTTYSSDGSTPHGSVFFMSTLPGGTVATNVSSAKWQVYFDPPLSAAAKNSIPANMITVDRGDIARPEAIRFTLTPLESAPGAADFILTLAEAGFKGPITPTVDGLVINTPDGPYDVVASESIDYEGRPFGAHPGSHLCSCLDQGAGTAEEPYEICSPSQYDSFTSSVVAGKFYALCTSLDFFQWPNGLSPQIPFFNGNFNGNGFTLHNPGRALFDQAQDANFNDIRIENDEDFIPVEPNLLDSIAGGLVNQSINTHYQGISIQNGWVSAAMHAGGIVGTASGGTVIQQSVYSGSVNSPNYAGGLIGTATDTVIIDRSAVYQPTFSRSITGGIVGGLIGSTQNETTVMKSWVKSRITGSNLSAPYAAYYSVMGGMVGFGGGSFQDVRIDALIAPALLTPVNRTAGGVVGLPCQHTTVNHAILGEFSIEDLGPGSSYMGLLWGDWTIYGNDYFGLNVYRWGSGCPPSNGVCELHPILAGIFTQGVVAKSWAELTHSMHLFSAGGFNFVTDWFIPPDDLPVPRGLPDFPGIPSAPDLSSLGAFETLPASMVIIEGTGFPCTGVLLDATHVLTRASHCGELPIGSLVVKSGFAQWNPRSGAVLLSGVAQASLHPQFVGSGEHDLAILKLATPIPITDLVRYAQLPAPGSMSFNTDSPLIGVSPYHPINGYSPDTYRFPLSVIGPDDLTLGADTQFGVQNQDIQFHSGMNVVIYNQDQSVVYGIGTPKAGAANSGSGIDIIDRLDDPVNYEWIINGITNN